VLAGPSSWETWQEVVELEQITLEPEVTWYRFAPTAALQFTTEVFEDEIVKIPEDTAAGLTVTGTVRSTLLASSLTVMTTVVLPE
jgi:hypothetical protein